MTLFWKLKLKKESVSDKSISYHFLVARGNLNIFISGFRNVEIWTLSSVEGIWKLMRHGMRTKSIGRKGAWISQISKYKRTDREKIQIRTVNNFRLQWWSSLTPLFKGIKAWISAYLNKKAPLFATLFVDNWLPGIDGCLRLLRD